MLTKFRLPFSLALLTFGILVGCGGHHSGGSGAATDTIVFNNGKTAAVSDDAKSADEAKLSGQFGASWGSDNSALARQLVATMQTMPEFREGGIGVDGTAWGRYTDGTYIGFLTNDPDGPDTTPAAARMKPSALAKQGKSVVGPKDLPGAAVAYVYEAMEPARIQATPTIVDELKAAGYRVVTGSGTLDDWAHVSGAGVLVNHSHGGITDGNYYVTTGETPTALQTGMHFDELQHGDMMRVWVEVYDSPTTHHDEERYAFNIRHLRAQAGFGTMFAKDSLFLNMTCSGTETGSLPFSYGLQAQAGLDVYAGWSNEVETDDENEMALFFMDRALGLDRAAPVDPSQPPPANWRSIKATMGATSHQDGRTGSIDKSYVHHNGTTTLAELKFLDSTGGKLTTLIPSATSASLTADGTNVEIKGDFGVDQGTVTVAGKQLTVVSWSSSKIVAVKPDATDKVFVTSPTGLIGNSVPIAGSLLTITPKGPSVALGSTTTFTVATELGSFPSGAKFTWIVKGAGTVGGSSSTTTTVPHVEYVAPSTVTTDTLTVSVKDASGGSLGNAGTNIDVSGSFNITPGTLPVGLPLYGGGTFSVQNTTGLPSGVQYVWTTGQGLLAVDTQTPGAKTVTTPYPTIRYTVSDPFPKTGAVVNDFVSVKILDASGKTLGSGSATVALGGYSYMDVTYPYDATHLALRTPAFTRTPSGRSTGSTYDLFEFEIPNGNGGDLVDFRLLVAPGATPTVGDVYTWKDHNDRNRLPGDLNFLGSMTAASYITTGTLTITSAIPAPDGGTFIGYTFHFDTTSTSGFTQGNPIAGYGVQDIHP